VVREARRLGVPTPVNDWLYAALLRSTAAGAGAADVPAPPDGATASASRL